MAKDLPSKPKGGSPLSKQSMYSKVASHGEEIIDFLLAQMRDTSIQDSVRQSAANKLIDKVLPNLKASELTGKDGEKLQGLIIIRPPKD